jgi:hypothetical protein
MQPQVEKPENTIVFKIYCDEAEARRRVDDFVAASLKQNIERCKRGVAATTGPDMRHKLPEVWEREVRRQAEHCAATMMETLKQEAQRFTDEITAKLASAGLTQLHTLGLILNNGRFHDHAEKIVAAVMAEATTTAAETVPAG